MAACSSADLGAGAAITDSFTVEAMVRGYHVYKDVWSAALGEQLSCQREPTNTRDPFAVAVVRSLVTVGHISTKISSICSMFLLRGGTITCRVTASSWRFTPRRTGDPLHADIQRDHERHCQDH